MQEITVRNRHVRGRIIPIIMGQLNFTGAKAKTFCAHYAVERADTPLVRIGWQVRPEGDAGLPSFFLFAPRLVPPRQPCNTAALGCGNGPGWLGHRRRRNSPNRSGMPGAALQCRRRVRRHRGHSAHDCRPGLLPPAIAGAALQSGDQGQPEFCGPNSTSAARLPPSPRSRLDCPLTNSGRLAEIGPHCGLRGPASAIGMDRILMPHYILERDFPD